MIGSCNKCGYAGKCEDDGTHYRRNGTKCSYAAIAISKAPPMKNLDPKRREELQKRMDRGYTPEQEARWEVSEPTGGLTIAELRTLLAASELLDDALAENRAWRTDPELTGYQSAATRKAVKHTDTTAARLGWELEGR